MVELRGRGVTENTAAAFLDKIDPKHSKYAKNTGAKYFVKQI
jgi:hypothetical protein